MAPSAGIHVGPGSRRRQVRGRCGPWRCRRRASTIPCSSTSSDRGRGNLVLQAAGPGLGVLDGIGVVHDRRADDAGGIGGQDVAGPVSRDQLGRRHVHLPRVEERQIAREGGLHAVGPLVEEDAVAAADHRARVVEREREAGSRGQPDQARAEQAAVPARLARRDVGDGNQRQQRLRAPSSSAARSSPAMTNRPPGVS